MQDVLIGLIFYVLKTIRVYRRVSACNRLFKQPVSVYRRVSAVRYFCTPAIAAIKCSGHSAATQS